MQLGSANRHDANMETHSVPVPVPIQILVAIRLVCPPVRTTTTEKALEEALESGVFPTQMLHNFISIPIYRNAHIHIVLCVCGVHADVSKYPVSTLCHLKKLCFFLLRSLPLHT